MRVAFNNIGKLNNGLVGAYGVSVGPDNKPIASATVTLVEQRGGTLLDLEPGVVYEITLAPVKLPNP